MRISKLVGERTKEVSSQITCRSQALMLRAGYIKMVSNGIYTLTMPAQRVSRKIQQIIREEMDRVEGQEVLFPVVMPREMWDLSGRYESIGSEMVRFKDRAGHDMLLGMTHEEAAVHLFNNTVKSYDQLPCMVYQIQTKFRDEPRPRAGLIRVREFTMKDAYSFHTSQEDLNEYYNKLYDAYCRIYNRMGMKNFVVVKSDNGMMGGKVAHEFQLLTEIGDESIVGCEGCDYKSNMEVATCVLSKSNSQDAELKEIYTGDAKTIEEVCALLKLEPKNTCKAVCYAVVGDDKRTVVVFIRGDREVNEIKLKNFIGAEVVVKDLADEGLVAGNIGCVNLNVDNMTMVFDESLKGEKNLVTGANKEGYHFVGLNVERDVVDAKFIDVSKVEDGDVCPICGGRLNVKRGIEVGNIFQLETKYTKSMNCTVAMPDGTNMHPLMACYGIGVGRCMASIAEERADDKGLVWPMAIAPWHIYLCPIKYDDEVVKNATDVLYSSLEANGIECLLDDRTNVSAGVKFADSELMGIPVRIVVSPRSLANGEVEVSIRETGEKMMIKQSDLMDFVVAFVKGKAN
ncbi:MAG: proline--tRNA ligase [Clostridia bacterium]|nr:proline--tRNA ligase [Clostridia bacterium]